MLKIGDECFKSRLIMGTALYPSPDILRRALIASESQIATVSLRRESSMSFGGDNFVSYITEAGFRLLPNTANSYSAEQAVLTARMSRDLFNTNWIKLEVIGDSESLHPNPFELLKAAKILIAEGFEVFPYTSDDLIVAQKLVEAGCRIVMPWASQIGSGQGPANIRALETLRLRLPDVLLIVDAGIGRPSHATQIMELGYDAVLLNSAIALAHDQEKMAEAFSLAVKSGRSAFKSGMMPKRDFASPSTPILGTPFRNEGVKAI